MSGPDDWRSTSSTAFSTASLRGVIGSTSMPSGFVVERHHEAGAAHAAQLVEHQRPERHRQRAKVTDAGGHRMREAAGAGDQAFELRWRAAARPRSRSTAPGRTAPPAASAATSARAANAARGTLAASSRKNSVAITGNHEWLPVGSHCRARCGSAAAVFRCRADADAGG